VQDFGCETSLLQVCLQLQRAAGISGNDNVRFYVQQAIQFASAESIGHFGLSEVVGTGGAAAEFGFRDVLQCDSGNHLQQIARLLANFLSVLQVAGILYGDDGVDVTGGANGSQLHEEFVDIHDFCGEFRG